MTKKKLWRITKVVLKIAVTAAALYWVFNKIDAEPEHLKNSLMNSNPLFFVLAFLTYTISIFIASYRLNGFFQGIGLQLSERFNLKLYLLGLFYNLFLPGGIGGDGYKIYFLRKKFAVKGRRLLLAVFLDRLSGLWGMCVIIAALIIFIPMLAIPSYLPVGVVALGTVIYYLIIRRYFPAFGPRFFTNHLKALGVQSMQIISVILILYALGFDGKFSPYLLMFLFSSLAAIIPLSIAGGLGIREVAFVFGAGYFLLDKDLSVLVSLSFNFVSALLALFGAYFLLRPSALGEKRLPDPEEDRASADPQ